MALSMHQTGPAFPQLGEYDENILCAECDNKLGVFDNYALKVCKEFPQKHTTPRDNIFEMPDVDGDSFAKFVLAVLWRASISKRPAAAAVRLGKHESIARDVLFGAKPLNAMSAFRVLFQRYTSDHLDPAGIYTLPTRAAFHHWNSYGFAVSGFRVAAIIDSRPMPAALASYIVNGSKSLRGSFKRFEDTSEFEAAANMVVADARRKGVPPWKLNK
jgi:hypothetical protein